jgi:prepilin-type N-terminal cleavage/methylation domain-containing protein
MKDSSMIRSPKRGSGVSPEIKPIPRGRGAHATGFTLIELPAVRQSQRHAFTLIELMISIAMVVVLMLGITKVFSLTSQTAGATNQLSSFLRDSRAAQAVFYQDLSTAVSDGAPCMLLCSSRVSAFRNKADELGARDWASNPIETNIRHIDLNGDNKEGDTTIPGELIPTTATNNRSHRIDTFSFFSRQRLQRQTGGYFNSPGPNTPLLAEMSANEAWIWYGHLQLPDNNGAFNANTLPGAGLSSSNPNNLYASQWILGRVATLLRNGNMIDRKNIPQAFIDKLPPVSPLPASPPLDFTSLHNLLEPLAGYSASNPSGYSISNSRYDLANTSIDDFNGRLNTWLAYTSAPTTDNWWGDLFCGGVINPRFQANPFVTKPITAASLSQQAPVFLSGCTQFIVEYAGDFVSQDPNTGIVTNVYTNNNGNGDGQIDFILTNVGGNISKKIRWYGLPRDTDGSASRSPDGFIPVTTVAANINQMVDVVPLRDIWRTSSTPGVAPYDTHAPFEKFTWTQGSGTTPAPASPPVLKDVGNGGDYTNGISGMTPTDQYICAFGPTDPKPKMIRITMTLDDPGGTLPDGVTFQYVFTLP